MLSKMALQPALAAPMMARCMNTYLANKTLAEDDPAIYELAKEEKMRQRMGMELIASEVSVPVRPVFVQRLFVQDVFVQSY